MQVILKCLLSILLCWFFTLLAAASESNGDARLHRARRNSGVDNMEVLGMDSFDDENTLDRLRIKFDSGTHLYNEHKNNKKSDDKSQFPRGWNREDIGSAIYVAIGQTTSWTRDASNANRYITEQTVQYKNEEIRIKVVVEKIKYKGTPRVTEPFVRVVTAYPLTSQGSRRRS